MSSSPVSLRVLGISLLLCAVLRDDTKANTRMPTKGGWLAAQQKLCGPRCVDFVLRYYGREHPGLVLLIKEMQWPAIEAGTSMSRIACGLDSRGVYTSAVRLPAGSIVHWRHPVILHFQSEDDYPDGHFVVQLPSSNSNGIRIWDGLNGVRIITAYEVARLMSGAIILTSPTPITAAEQEQAVYSVGSDWPQHILVVVLIAFFVAGLWLLRRTTPGCIVAPRDEGTTLKSCPINEGPPS